MRVRHMVVAGLAAAALAGAAAIPAAASPPLAIFGDNWTGQPTVLTVFDSRTVLPMGQPLLEIGEFHSTAAMAPDGRRLALGVSFWSETGHSERIGAAIFDLQIRAITEVPTGIAAEEVAWFAPERVAALLQTGHVVTFDGRTGRILRRVAVAKLGCTYDVATAGRRAVFLLGGRNAVAHLAVAGPDRRIRSVRLPAVRYGSPGTACQRRALAVRGTRAYVVAAGTRTITEVRLDTLRVIEHRVAGLPGTREREVAAAGAGLVVAGTDATGPAGAVAVDTRRWRARPLDRAASGAVRISRLVLTFAGGAGRRPAGQRQGVRAFGADDLRRRWSRSTAAPVWDVQATVGSLFARSDRGITVLEPASGRVLGRRAYPPHARLLLVG